MQQFSTSSSRPLTLSSSTQMQTYGLFAVAMALTLVGVMLGMNFAQYLLGTGFHIIFAIVEIGLVVTAGWWSRTSPINYLLFGLFPIISGITLTPYLLLILTGYANGPIILFNAVSATIFMSLAAVVLSRIAPGLSLMGRGLFFAILGLLFLGILQIFFPAFRGGTMELLISGAGIAIFGLFTAYDLQRIERMGQAGANPFLLALSLYLDIYNLFLYIVRFMTALSGERR